MKKTYYPLVYLFLLFVAMASCINYVHADGTKPMKRDTNKLNKVFPNKNDKSYLKNGLHELPPLKPAITIYGGSSITKPAFPRYEPAKVITNVQVYPNPISDQINLRYNVAKNSNVTIKIMDILGNDIMTLFSQRVDSGEQKFTFNINSKLPSGFYFVRLVIGSESVYKRIAIL